MTRKFKTAGQVINKKELYLCSMNRGTALLSGAQGSLLVIFKGGTLPKGRIQDLFPDT